VLFKPIQSTAFHQSINTHFQYIVDVQLVCQTLLQANILTLLNIALPVPKALSYQLIVKFFKVHNVALLGVKFLNVSQEQSKIIPFPQLSAVSHNQAQVKGCGYTYKNFVL
jgi:hypothetical protein